MRYSGVSRESVQGKRFLELGPGFTMSVPLLFIADGASYVAGVDKFGPFRDGPYDRRYYGRLRETLDAGAKERYDRAIGLDPVALNPEIAAYVYGKDLTEVVDRLGRNSYDLIVSNAVLEEIF